MSHDAPEPSPVDNLQFDQAESNVTASSGPSCAACQQPLQGSYFEINGHLVCSNCRDVIEGSLHSGSKTWRFMKAAVYGIGAAAVGTLIYFGVRAATGYEVGLIAILVGLMVGGAVKKGSDGRGGWLYRGLAMYLTYASIVATYVPLIIQAARDKPAATAKADGKAEPAKDQAAKDKQAEDDLANMSKPALIAGVAAVLFIVFLFAHAVPIMMGPENFIGWVIIGIGLYEAWKMNPRPPAITGPYQLSPAGMGEGANVHDSPDHAD